MAGEFLEQVRSNMRLRGYSLSTEKTYLLWIRRFIHFTGNEHPVTVHLSQIGSYLTYLAVKRGVSVNTKKNALNSLVYLFEKFLTREMGDLGFKLATKQRTLPNVLSVDEVRSVLIQLSGRNKLILQLLYGSGLRVGERLRLRVQDIDLNRFVLTIYSGKGRKDRQTLLSSQRKGGLEDQIEFGVGIHRNDNKRSVG